MFFRFFLYAKSRLLLNSAKLSDEMSWVIVTDSWLKILLRPDWLAKKKKKSEKTEGRKRERAH